MVQAENNPSIGTDDATNYYTIWHEHTAGIAVTVDHAKNPKTLNEHRNWFNDRMVNWCLREYPAFAIRGLRPVTLHELEDTTKHFHHQHIDFVYNMIDYNIIKANLSKVCIENIYSTGKTKSHSHIRRFHDAILFGAVKQGILLPKLYHQEIDTCLHSFWKEATKACRYGDTDELEANPMAFPLNLQLSTWNVESGDLFSWL